MKDFLKKFTSRKFLACAAGILIGVCMIFGIDEGTITAIAGAVTASASVISYIIAEGKIDAASIAKIADVSNQIEEVADMVVDLDDTQETVE